MNKTLAAIGTAAAVGAAGTGTIAVDARINPYTDRTTHYELPITSDIPQGERVEIAKDKAEMTLKGWNDEYAIKITPQIPAAQFGSARRDFNTSAKRPLLSKRMEYKSGDVTAFIEPREGATNEFDIDFTLDSKPDTNIFQYRIEGAEDFDFFYQPPLTPEEIEQGAEQPKNVVGSYAVYHKTKANHRVGSTNYATGKAFHIYRPKAIDAEGNEIWAQLHYADGVLSVSVNPLWLEDAMYPVVVDPTFGYTTAGSYSINLAGIGSPHMRTYHIRGTHFTAPNTGNVSSVTYYGDADIEGQWGMIYLESDDSLLGASNEDTRSEETGWITMSLTSGCVQSGTKYWIVAQADGLAKDIYYDSGTNSAWASRSGGSAPPDPWSPIDEATIKYSVYATYTTGACAGGSRRIILPD